MHKKRLKYLTIMVIIFGILFSGCISSDDSEDTGTSAFADAKLQVEMIVDNAVALIEDKGPDCFDEFRYSSEWNYDDMYVYVWKTNGIRIVYPPDTTLENIDVSDLEDAKGRPIGQLFIETAINPPYEGWVVYEWPKPDSDISELKFSFHKKATYSGVEYLVGSGIYATNYLFIENLETCDNIIPNEDNDGLFTVCEVYNPGLYDARYGGDLSISTITMEPGTSLTPHAMKNAELHIVLSGEGTLYIENLPVPLAENDCILVPAGATQYVTASDATSLTIMMINQPAWCAENEEKR